MFVRRTDQGGQDAAQPVANSSPQAIDLITYIGVPLTVAGIVPLIWNMVKAFLIWNNLRKKIPRHVRQWFTLIPDPAAGVVNVTTTVPYMNMNRLWVDLCQPHGRHESIPLEPQKPSLVKAGQRALACSVRWARNFRLISRAPASQREKREEPDSSEAIETACVKASPTGPTTSSRLLSSTHASLPCTELKKKTSSFDARRVEPGHCCNGSAVLASIIDLDLVQLDDMHFPMRSPLQRSAFTSEIRFRSKVDFDMRFRDPFMFGLLYLNFIFCALAKHVHPFDLQDFDKTKEIRMNDENRVAFLKRSETDISVVLEVQPIVAVAKFEPRCAFAYYNIMVVGRPKGWFCWGLGQQYMHPLGEIITSSEHPFTSRTLRRDTKEARVLPDPETEVSKIFGSRFPWAWKLEWLLEHKGPEFLVNPELRLKWAVIWDLYALGCSESLPQRLLEVENRGRSLCVLLQLDREGSLEDLVERLFPETVSVYKDHFKFGDDTTQLVPLASMILKELRDKFTTVDFVVHCSQAYETLESLRHGVESEDAACLSRDGLDCLTERFSKEMERLNRLIETQNWIQENSSWLHLRDLHQSTLLLAPTLLGPKDDGPQYDGVFRDGKILKSTSNANSTIPMGKYRQPSKPEPLTGLCGTNWLCRNSPNLIRLRGLLDPHHSDHKIEETNLEEKSDDAYLGHVLVGLGDIESSYRATWRLDNAAKTCFLEIMTLLKMLSERTIESNLNLDYEAIRNQLLVQLQRGLSYAEEGFLVTSTEDGIPAEEACLSRSSPFARYRDKMVYLQ